MRASLLAAAAGGAMLACPAVAKTATPQDNLDCAIWATYRIGIAAEDEERNGLMLATAWFSGLYEGQTGTTIDEAMIARSRALTPAQIEAFEPACLARFGDFGNRFTAIGERLGAGSN
ncbi:hypothetical protein [Erythrobacter sp. CCH5-A1]|uniref:hypothetical protein n=1 Tax=Erythrobacter sp. CCH5-A1 TaxID=1768792 RepID=UPI0012E3B280|nr:hypothetical protein [Erythrobacter sp. CCH5-A1]